MAELVKGAKELERMLALMPAKVAKKTVRRAVRSGQKVIMAKVKENAKNLVGGKMGSLISKKTKIKAPKRQKRGQYSLNTTVIADPEFEHINKELKGGKEVRHWIPSAIEFGHGPNKENVARPYMRNAADTAGDKAIDVAIKELGDGIVREAKLLAK